MPKVPRATDAQIAVWIDTQLEYWFDGIPVIQPLIVRLLESEGIRKSQEEELQRLRVLYKEGGERKSSHRQHRPLPGECCECHPAAAGPSTIVQLPGRPELSVVGCANCRRPLEPYPDSP